MNHRISYIVRLSILLVLVPAFHISSPAQTTDNWVSVEGTLFHTIIDRYEPQVSLTLYGLRTDDGETYQLGPDIQGLTDSQIGSRVRVSAILNEMQQQESELIPGPLLTKGSLTVTQSNHKLDDRQNLSIGETRVAVILVNFPEDRSRPWTRDEVYEHYFGEENSVDAFVRANSYGKAWITGDVYGWYELEEVTRDNDTFDQAIAASDEKIEFLIDGNQNIDQVVIAYPRNPSQDIFGIFTGHRPFETADGTSDVVDLIYINGHATVLGTTAHEQIHSYDIGHALRWEGCQPGYFQGLDCRHINYGNSYDIMGRAKTSNDHINAVFKRSLGWVDEMNVTYVTESGVYTIAPLELASSQTQALILRRDFETDYYVEYRGSREDGDLGILITFRLQFRGSLSSSTIRHHSGNELLQPGQEFYDPVAGVRIVPVALRSGGIDVQIDISEPSPLPRVVIKTGPYSRMFEQLLLYGDRIMWDDGFGERITVNLLEHSGREDQQLSHSDASQLPQFGIATVWFSGSGWFDSWSYGQSSWDISGELIVWEQPRDREGDIYLYDMRSDQEFTLDQSDGMQVGPVIDGSIVAWEDGPSSKIILYDHSTKVKRAITETNPADQSDPAIDSGRIVWADFRNGNGDIYLFDVDSGLESAISTEPEEQTKPDISGDYVVWRTQMSNEYAITARNLQSNAEILLSQHADRESAPVIDGELVVWQTRKGIYLFDLSSWTEHLIASWPRRLSSPTISGSHIAWVQDSLCEDSQSCGADNIIIHDLGMDSQFEQSTLPESFVLHQNYPNPFNPTTTIPFSLTSSGPVSMVVYDILGRVVARPLDDVFPIGNHSITFNADGLGSGLYFYTLQTETRIQSKAMILVR